MQIHSRNQLAPSVYLNRKGPFRGLKLAGRSRNSADRINSESRHAFAGSNCGRRWNGQSNFSNQDDCSPDPLCPDPSYRKTDKLGTLCDCGPLVLSRLSSTPLNYGADGLDVLGLPPRNSSYRPPAPPARMATVAPTGIPVGGAAAAPAAPQSKAEAPAPAVAAAP